ncbi:TIGR02466 family protein [Synechococcus sp. MW101C3]|uniref:TIGR02466 family protein n=1 Tax=Synechococcus sp. MW101C3 TaxID=210768 RepID=UPI001E4ED07F|nr:TIGR02466 family protein [Synechococcus sp. MW101C3]
MARRWAEAIIEIQPLFPLALGRQQLRPDPLDSALMLQEALQLRGAANGNPSEGCAWTGDLNDAWQVHRRPAFGWLVTQLELAAPAYLRALGFDTEQIDLHLQRAWPVVSEPGQAVGRHHHPNAHLSAVYYITGDGSGRCGCLRLFPHRQMNELVPGLAVGHSGPITPDHPLNAPWQDVAPQAGLLVLFPASTDHAVLPNEDDERRCSVSFDLFLSARSSSSHPPEFLAPHPGAWTPFARTA